MAANIKVGFGASRESHSSNSEVSKDGLMAMKKELSEAASLFPEKIRFNVVGYACTSASSIIGSEVVSDMIRKGCTTQRFATLSQH